MKKNLYLLLIITVLIMTGCKAKDKMTDFIPTPTVTPDDGSADSPKETAKDTEDSSDVKPTIDPNNVGPTTKKYVKMTEYGATLNVRNTPSTDGEKVGFLAHAQEIDVIKIENGWASFVMDGAVCYVKADYLTDTRPAYLQPPTVTPTPIATPTPKATPTIKATPTPKATSTPVPKKDINKSSSEE